MAKSFGTRPSLLLGLTGPDDAWLGYQYDGAAARLGLYCEAMLGLRDDKGRPRFALAGLLSDQPTAGTPARYSTDFSRIPLDGD